jgi:hypothetical protein
MEQQWVWIDRKRTFKNKFNNYRDKLLWNEVSDIFLRNFILPPTRKKCQETEVFAQC